MAALSATNKAYLNRWSGSMAYRIQLGTIIEDALAVTAAELTAIGDGKILIGAASTGIATAQTLSGDVTVTNAGVTAIGASKVLTAMLNADCVNGTKIADDAIDSEHIAAGAIDEEHLSAALKENAPGQMIVDCTTEGFVTGGLGALGAPAVADTSVNCIRTTGGKHFEWRNINQQDMAAGTFGWSAGVGWFINGDKTDNDGLEIGNGATSSDVQKVVDTDDFYFRAKVIIADVSGTDRFHIGLRKAAAYGADCTAYTDYAAVGFLAADGTIDITTNLNNAGAATTDTTDSIADGEYLDVKIYQGNSARLATCIDLANALKATMNTHFADATEHTASQQTAVASADATDYATLVTLTTELMASFVTHSDDANLAAAWVYHDAQSAGDDSLASEVAPTTIAECVTRLNDVKAKLNLHVARGANAPHADGDSGTCACVDACNTYFQIGANAALGDPTVTKAFNFDTGDTLVPYISFLHATTSPTDITLTNWEIVNVTTTVS